MLTDLYKCIAEIEFRFPCVRDHESTREEWQTLKAAIAQPATSAANIDLANILSGAVSLCHDGDFDLGYKLIAEVIDQLRAVPENFEH